MSAHGKSLNPNEVTRLGELGPKLMKIGGAVGLLIFLLLFLNTLSSTLLGFFVGAIENNSADLHGTTSTLTSGEVDQLVQFLLELE